MRKLSNEEIKEANERSQSQLDDMRAELRTLAKRANQRMVRLERQDEYSYAYEKAQNFLNRRNKTRFTESTKNLSFEETQKQLVQVNKFLNSVTSTKQGIKKINKEKKERLTNMLSDLARKKLTNNQVDDAVQLLKNQRFMNNLRKIYGSEPLFEAVAKIVVHKDRDKFVDVISKGFTEGMFIVKTEEDARTLNEVLGVQVSRAEKPLFEDENQDDSDSI